MAGRNITRLVRGTPAIDGAGVRLVRVLGTSTIRDFDPFLMLDAFDSRNPADYVRGFPMHPHRGIETFTYLVRGEIDHKDSLGNEGRIMDGSCQWMTAGGGILHQEMPRPAERLLGLQLWINLPARAKMVAPRYRDLTSSMIPEISEPGGKVRVVAGSYKDSKGATRGEYVDARFLDIALQPEGRLNVDTRPGDTVFVYGLEGSCRFGDNEELVPARQALLFSDGDTLSMRAGPEGSRMVMVSGAPLREPVAWGGPIVMNTEAELDQAFTELERGTFIRHAGRA